MYLRYNTGILEMIVGPMFSGKSHELIRAIKAVSYSGTKTLVFKPEIDTREEEQIIASRNGGEIKTLVIKEAKEIINFWSDEYMAVAIDEAQFLDDSLFETIDFLLEKGVRIMISALDMDYRGRPFGIVPNLLAIADRIQKLPAICVQCGDAATMSYRKQGSMHDTIEIGDESYEARCRQCYKKGVQCSTQELRVN